MKSKKIVISLVTGNENKLKEFQSILSDVVEIKRVDVDLPEVQGDPIQIAKEKAMIAYRKAKKAVVIEDTSLCFNCMKGLPGPYIKWFSQKLGNDGLFKIIDGFEDHSGYAQCIISYMSKPLKEPLIFIGKTNGTIVSPRGAKNFGWDPIFQPEGKTQTFAEMEDTEKNEISHRKKAINEMLKYFKESAVSSSK